MLKKSFFTFIFLSAFSLSAHAFMFVPSMSFFVNRDIATTRVFNTAMFPIVCSGTAFGRTISGVVLNSWINNLVIYPGQWADATVFSNYYDPFMQAWANITCSRAF